MIHIVQEDILWNRELEKCINEAERNSFSKKMHVFSDRLVVV